MTPDPCWLLSAIIEFPWGTLGILLSIILSVLACGIAHGSEQKMKKLSAYHIEEKIAMMAVHSHNLASKVGSLERISQFRNDLKAISKLQKYITPNQQEELDQWLHIIMGMLNNAKKSFFTTQIPLWIDAYNDINNTLKEIGFKAYDDIGN